MLSSGQKFVEVQKQIAERFGGAAQAQAATYAGRLEILKNTFNDFQEIIGKFFLPVAEKWLDWAQRGINAINRFTGAT